MKNILLASILSVFSISAFAAGTVTPLSTSDEGLSFIEGRVISARPLCPRDQNVACFVDGTVVEVLFGLNGCVDRLGPVTWKATETEDGKIELVIAAVNIHNEASNHVRCFVQATQKVSITLIDQYGDVEAEFLK